jgi:hypothetical protein
MIFISEQNHKAFSITQWGLVMVDEPKNTVEIDAIRMRMGLLVSDIGVIMKSALTKLETSAAPLWIFGETYALLLEANARLVRVMALVESHEISLSPPPTMTPSVVIKGVGDA